MSKNQERVTIYRRDDLNQLTVDVPTNVEEEQRIENFRRILAALGEPTSFGLSTDVQSLLVTELDDHKGQNRWSNSLNKRGICTVGDVIKKDPYTLLGVTQFGVLKFVRMLESFQQHGIIPPNSSNRPPATNSF